MVSLVELSFTSIIPVSGAGMIAEAAIVSESCSTREAMCGNRVCGFQFIDHYSICKTEQPPLIRKFVGIRQPRRVRL